MAGVIDMGDSQCSGCCIGLLHARSFPAWGRSHRHENVRVPALLHGAVSDIGQEEGMPLSTFVGTRDLLALSPPNPCCTVPGRVLWVVCVCEGAFRGVFLFLSLGAFLW